MRRELLRNHIRAKVRLTEIAVKSNKGWAAAAGNVAGVILPARLIIRLEFSESRIRHAGRVQETYATLKA
jgi:hypothetical protein